MLDRYQDRTIQDLAHSITNSVHRLGTDCTVHLLASIALALSDTLDSEGRRGSEGTAAEFDSSPWSLGSFPSSSRSDVPNRQTRHQRRWTRP